MPTKMVYIYLRYSSTMQKQESIEAQRRAIEQYCKEKGYKIKGEYVDEAKSATTDDRPQFQQMMKDAAKSDIYAVVVHKLDRFARNKFDSYSYKCFLQKKGIKLISVIEPLDDTPESEMLESMIFAMNEFYSKNLGREVQKGKKEVAYKGLHTGGVPPYGYDVDENRKYVINKKESKAVKLIFDMYINDYSYQNIADYLNSHGYTTKKGLPFNKNSFSSILDNAERYTGTYIYNRAAPKFIDGTRNSHKYKDENEIIKIANGIPRIISDDTYIKAIEKAKLNKENAGRFHSKRYYLLNGLIVCGECGRAFTGNTSYAGRNKTEYITYRCGGYRGDCCNKAINLNYLDNYVIDLLTNIIFDEKNYKYIIKALNKKLNKAKSKNSTDIIRIKNELNQLDFSINKLTSALEKADSSEAIINKLIALEKKKMTLENKYDYYKNYKPKAVNSDDIDNTKKIFKEFMLKHDLPMCRKLIRSFVKEIVVYRDKVEVTIKTSEEHKKGA